MDDSFAEITIFENKELYQKFEDKFASDIIDIVELDESILVKHRSTNIGDNTSLDNANETHNTNVAIASAITAYARVHMSQFKNNPDFNLYYSDTDSVYIDKPLSDDLVNEKILGQMKLENVINKAIFLSPKVYCLVTEASKLIFKVKGLSHKTEMTFNDYESLLIKDSFLQRFQTK